MSNQEKNRSVIGRLHWTPTIFLTITPLIALCLCIWYFSTESLTLAIASLTFFFWLATGVSITAGYHRLFSHKAYDAHWSLRLLYALFGAATFQNSILRWVVDHRMHHRYVDQEKDPYGAPKGLFYSHIGWMFLKAPPKKDQVWAKDLLKDPIVVWQDKYYVYVASFMGIILPGLLGWACGSWLGGLALAGLGRLVVVHHSTFFINSLAHYIGKQPFSDSHTARDNGLLALFTYGEGYHNFHHQFANDYRNGIRWFDYDPTKWVIGSMHRLGLAKNLVSTPDIDILTAKMEMAEKALVADSRSESLPETLSNQLIQLREKVIEARKRWHQLKIDFQNYRKSNNRSTWSQEIKRARKEFRQAYKEWKSLLRSLGQQYGSI